MANSEGIAGVHSYILWGSETTFNTAVGVDKHFSGVVSDFRGSINNNTISNYAFSGTNDYDGRKVYNYSHGVLEISGTLNFKPTNFRFFKHVLGNESGVGPYTYSVAAIPPSMTIASDIDNPGATATDQEATYSGCVVESFTLRSAVGQPCTATMELKMAKVVIDTALSTRVALPTEGAYNFAYGSIELPSGSTLTNIIDSVELTIRNQWDMLAGVGSRLVQNALPKGLVLNVKVSLKYLDNALFTAALGATTPTATGGPTEYATMVLNFGNTDGDTFEITLSKVPMSEFAQIHELNNPIGEDLTFTAGDISAVETLA